MTTTRSVSRRSVFRDQTDRDRSTTPQSLEVAWRDDAVFRRHSLDVGPSLTKIGRLYPPPRNGSCCVAAAVRTPGISATAATVRVIDSRRSASPIGPLTTTSATTSPSSARRGQRIEIRDTSRDEPGTDGNHNSDRHFDDESQCSRRPPRPSIPPVRPAPNAIGRSLPQRHGRREDDADRGREAMAIADVKTAKPGVVTSLHGPSGSTRASTPAAAMATAVHRPRGDGEKHGLQRAADRSAAVALRRVSNGPRGRYGARRLAPASVPPR